MSCKQGGLGNILKEEFLNFQLSILRNKINSLAQDLLHWVTFDYETLFQRMIFSKNSTNPFLFFKKPGYVDQKMEKDHKAYLQKHR